MLYVSAGLYVEKLWLYVSVSALVFDFPAQNKRAVLKRGTAWNWLSLDSAAAAASCSEPSELRITARLVFHSAPRHYFRPEESWFVTVHIYNCDLGSRRRVTQPEPSWREVTNEKQPKGSSLLYNRQMLEREYCIWADEAVDLSLRLEKCAFWWCGFGSWRAGASPSPRTKTHW